MAEFLTDIDPAYKKFLYLYEGEIVYGSDEQKIETGSMLIFGEGETIKLKSDGLSAFIIFAGKPLNEPVAWRGPIVMNSEYELDTAFRELKEGSFIR